MKREEKGKAIRAIQYRTGDETMPGFFESIAKANKPMTVAWIIDGKGAGARALCDRSEILFRDELFPEELAGMIRTEGQGILESAGSRVFVERITDGKKLVICGAGHVALCLIRIAVTLGYEVTVIEDREEYAGKARTAGVQHVACRPFGEALDEIPDDQLTAYVIMTREHAHDMECLRRILRKDFAYAGMMGSRSRTELVRRQMLEEGYDARKVERVHMPIGLPISSRTPEEIAVSVAAELISVLNTADPGEGFPAGMAEELAEAPQGVLAIIVEKEGEAPRRPGTKMLVRADGSFLGTVGGGYAEAKILKTARQMISEGDRESRLIRLTMEKGSMHCGGEITVFLTAVES